MCGRAANHHHHGYPCRVQVELYCLLRIVLQDALSEVTKIYSTLKLRVFVDDITALVKGRNKEVAELAKKVMKKVERRGERRLQIVNHLTRKGRMIASCGFLENEQSQFSKEGR